MQSPSATAFWVFAWHQLSLSFTPPSASWRMPCKVLAGRYTSNVCSIASMWMQRYADWRWIIFWATSILYAGLQVLVLQVDFTGVVPKRPQHMGMSRPAQFLLTSWLCFEYSHLSSQCPRFCSDDNRQESLADCCYSHPTQACGCIIYEQLRERFPDMQVWLLPPCLWFDMLHLISHGIDPVDLCFSQHPGISCNRKYHTISSKLWFQEQRQCQMHNGIENMHDDGLLKQWPCS